MTVTTVPVARFMADVAEKLDGQTPAAIVGDRFRHAEFLEALRDAGLERVPFIWRGFGWKDGSEDCERLRRAVFEGEVKAMSSLLLRSALLHTLEVALAEVYSNAPLGSSVIPFPEAADQDMTALARGFRGFRGKVLVRESVNVTAAGGPAPQTDLKPTDVSPDLSKAMTKETLAATKASIEMVYGVLPGLSNAATTGPMVREAQRHLAQWVLQPVAGVIAEEVSDKLGQPVALDVMRPLQAYDAGGRARAAVGIVQALAQAKEAGVDPAMALKLVDWQE